MTIEDLREELREDAQRIERKVDKVLEEQADLRVKVAATEISTKAAHARAGKIEKGIAVVVLGIVTAAGALVWDVVKKKVS